MAAAPLNNTAVAILLVLNRAPRSGYDVKQFVDNSARYFWAASYGRIYPELKKLAKEGLIEGADGATGGRPRTVYSLTKAGKEVLGAWYREVPETLELRDEAMLKIFFGDAFEPDLVEDHIEARRRNSARILEELRAIEPLARERAENDNDPYPHETLLCGIAMQEAVIAWCDQAQTRTRKAR
jgi:DNA-binding PadR family transcriptional regulator